MENSSEKVRVYVDEKQIQPDLGLPVPSPVRSAKRPICNEPDQPHPENCDCLDEVSDEESDCDSESKL